MTDIGSPSADVPHDPDSQGCLLVMAAYSDLAYMAGPVAAETSSRVMMSPILGDFIETRFVDLGPRPAGSSSGPAASLIADEFTRPESGAAENFCALAVLDTSAAAADRLLADCARHPWIAALPCRYLGLAATDDRDPNPQLPDAAQHQEDIKVPPPGDWTADHLVRQLRRFAEVLLDDFATSRQRGLTRAELAQVRGLNVGGPAALAVEAQITVPGYADPAPAAHQSADDVTPHPAAEWADVTPAGPVDEAARERRGPLRIPMPRLRRARAAAPPPSPPPVGVASGTAVPTMLVIVGDATADDRGAWGRCRSLLLEVDRLLALPQASSFKVRVWGGGPDTGQPGLRDAGELSRRDIKRPASPHDFARLLADLRLLMKRDLDRLARSGRPFAPPGVVFFATAAPLADAVTARTYRELADEAFVIWLLPDALLDLMSPSFAVGQTSILTDHPAAAEEVADLLAEHATQHVRA